MEKKGFTLVELVVVLGVLSIVITMEFQCFSFFTKLYNKETIYSKDILNMKEAVMFIEKEINEQTQYVEIDSVNSLIKIYKFTRIDNNTDIMDNINCYAQIEHIKLLNGSLVVLYGNSINKPNNTSYKNTILEQVNSFTVKRNNKLIYIEIRNINEVKVKKCLVVRNVK